MNTFPPKPGTVAYRVLAHLETILPRRPRATVGMIAGELRGLTPSQVRDACEAAHQAGYLTRSFEDSGIGRGPVFYELVRGTTGELALSAARAVEQPDPDFDEIQGSGTAVSPSGVIEPVVDPHPPEPDGPVLSEHATAGAPLSRVVSVRRTPQSLEVELERTPELSDWLRAAHGVPLARGGAAAPGAVAAEPEGPEVHVPVSSVSLQVDKPALPASTELPAEVTVALDFAPGPDQFAVALSSDGRLHCWRGVVPYVFSRLEVQQLVDYLNRVDLDDLLADAP